jgi:hypothetical protein
VKLPILIWLLFFYFLLVKALLEELECLVEDIYGITLTASLSALKVSDSHSIDSKLTTESCIMEVGSFCPNIPFLVPYFQCSVDQKKKLVVCNDQVKWKLGTRVSLHYRRRIKV